MPQSAWSAPAQNLMKYIPAPNLPGGVFSTSAYNQLLDDDKIGERVDANTRWGTSSATILWTTIRRTTLIPTAQGGANVPGFNGLNSGAGSWLSWATPKRWGRTR